MFRVNKKELCEILNVTTGTLKQMVKEKTLEEKVVKRGYKIVKTVKIGRNVYYDLLEMFDKNNLDEISKQYRNNSTKRRKYIDNIDNFDVPVFMENMPGVYKIQLDNYVYIGSTTVGYCDRYLGHMNKNIAISIRGFIYNDIEIKNTYDMLMNGGVYTPLYAMEEESEYEIRLMEEKFIEDYKLLNYNVVNIGKVSIKGRRNKPIKFKNIKIKEEDYENVINILKSNNITIYNDDN